MEKIAQITDQVVEQGGQIAPVVAKITTKPLIFKAIQH